MQPPIWTIKCQFEVQSIQVLMAEAKKLSQKEKKSNKIENIKTIQVSFNQMRSVRVIFPAGYFFISHKLRNKFSKSSTRIGWKRLHDFSKMLKSLFWGALSFCFIKLILLKVINLSESFSLPEMRYDYYKRKLVDCIYCSCNVTYRTEIKKCKLIQSN